MEHAIIDEKTKRVRSLLSSYYGAEGAQSQGGTPRSEHADTPSSARVTAGRLGGQRAIASLDSSAFEVDRCGLGMHALARRARSIPSAGVSACRAEYSHL
jgi:hypothetical protein